MDVHFIKSLEPSKVAVGGKECYLFFSMRSAALMESLLDMDFSDIVNSMFEVSGEAPLDLDRQVLVLACLMAEGARARFKEDVDVDAFCGFIESLHMNDFNKLVRAATQEILFKSVEKNTQKKT